jgi:hypothetical protein
VAALKRQLLQFSDIAERYATILKDGEMEPGMQEVLDRVQKLFVGQTNPFGESYAVQKVLNHYHSDLRAVFLYYAQVGGWALRDVGGKGLIGTSPRAHVSCWRVVGGAGRTAERRR